MFKGDRKYAEEFIVLCENKFMVEEEKFIKDKHKIGYIISLLRGDAFAWIAPYFSLGQQRVLTEYQFFRCEFLKVFLDPNRGLNAERKLYRLKQGKRSVTTMITEFQRLAVEAGFSMDDYALFGLFYEALNDEVKDELCKLPRPSHPH